VIKASDGGQHFSRNTVEEVLSLQFALTGGRMAKWLLVLLACCSAALWSQNTIMSGPQTDRQPAAQRLNTKTRAELEPTSETDRAIQSLQDHIKRVPGDYAGYDGLGEAYFQKARETGEIDYYNLAERSLKKSLDLVPADFRSAEPLVHMSLVYMGEHRFSEALAVTQKAIALGSGNLAAFAIEGDAYTDLGDYDDAQAAYNTGRALGAATSSPLGLDYMYDSRMAYLAFLHGDTAKSLQLMRSAITAALQVSVPRENLAWLYFELGERYFQVGDLPEAEESYAAGIAADPHHYRSLAGLGKVRAAQGRLDEAIQLYQRSLAIIPFPPYAAELGDVYVKSGRPTDASRQYDLVEYIGHLGKLNQVLANRELAMFYADRGIKLPEALDLARKELEVRHDIYTWDALAWALYKNGHLAEAASAMKKALRLKTDDSLLLFHSGMIFHSMGLDSDAETSLRRALQVNPHFHVFYAETATRTLDDISTLRNQGLRSSNAAR
jgi:tetratricopeptide (TPR) repeat protein